MGPIVSAHPEAFEEDQIDEWEQMTLALALFYEMTLGQSSYWYPYMISMPEGKFLCKWDIYDLELLQDKDLQFLLGDFDTGL